MRSLEQGIVIYDTVTRRVTHMRYDALKYIISVDTYIYILAHGMVSAAQITSAPYAQDICRLWCETR